MSKSSEVSRILDNKQIIHIVSEVVVLIGIIFYFSSKNKKLTSNVEELAHRLEQQEDQIQLLTQKLDSLGQQMGNGFMQMGQTLSQTADVVNELASKVESKGDSKPVAKSVPRVQQPRVVQQVVQQPRLVQKQEVARKGVVNSQGLSQGASQQGLTSGSQGLSQEVNESSSQQPVHRAPVLQEIKQEARSAKVKFTDPPRVEKPGAKPEVEDDSDTDDDLEDEEDDSDLDEEISEELGELMEDDTESSLKKRN